MNAPTTVSISARRWLGVPEHAVSWKERLVATGTSFTGIAIVVLVSQTTKGFAVDTAPLWLVGSIGASAVLVFAVPHGPLSQPWAVLGGHGFSALFGVAVARTIGSGFLGAALAVGGAIGIMHVLRCMHPPGGATALAAVTMVTATHDPSWQYVLSPVLLNAVTILVAAVVLNAPFAWRRYPLALAFPHVRSHAPDDLAQEAPFTAAQLAEALKQLGTVVYISDEELQVIYAALRRQQTEAMVHLEELRGGAYFSNGRMDDSWAVRRIIHLGAERAEPDTQLVVKTIAGMGQGTVATISADGFARWARYEVRPGASSWQRVAEPTGRTGDGVGSPVHG